MEQLPARYIPLLRSGGTCMPEGLLAYYERELEGRSYDFRINITDEVVAMWADIIAKYGVKQ